EEGPAGLSTSAGGVAPAGDGQDSTPEVCTGAEDAPCGEESEEGAEEGAEEGDGSGDAGDGSGDVGARAAAEEATACREDGHCARPCPPAEALAAGEAQRARACVPGGWFVRGVDEPVAGCAQADMPAGATPEVPAMRVWVDTFVMDVDEVTNAAHAACVRAGACREVGALYRDFRGAEQPHTGGTWFDARDYCAWRGMRLPTEAEFEAAARGPQGELTPFGDALVTCEEAVIEDARGRSCGVRQRGSRPEAGRVAEVGSRPAGRYGLRDLVGNAEEWVLDWWTEDWASCGEACAGPNPRGPCDGAEACPGHRHRAVRGGSWYWGAACATGVNRRRYRPDNRPPHHFGFRCAATVEG
ncbi:MAG: formylglycine-generating enzyme family protein, partial [Deltaproteobacteria bacterium]